MKEIYKNALSSGYLEFMARGILGAVFVYASFHKILNPEDFARIIFGYDLFPHAAINILAIFVPFFELFAGLFLITGIYPRSAAAILNVMLLLFILAIGANLIRGHEFDCGCFSIGESGHTSSATQLLFRNALLFWVGMHILVFKKQRRFCIYGK